MQQSRLPLLLLVKKSLYGLKQSPRTVNSSSAFNEQSGCICLIRALRIRPREVGLSKVRLLYSDLLCPSEAMRGYNSDESLSLLPVLHRFAPSSAGSSAGRATPLKPIL